MELGKKIRQLRLKAGLTQEQLAEKVGVVPQSVSKWENAAAMPDITALPMLAEVFGVTIDDLFDLTVEQRLNRIENRMDMKDDLPQDVYLEYEEFLKDQLNSEEHKKRATELIAYLYWHRMQGFARLAASYAKDAVRMTPAEKGCQWILNYTDRHKAWDWNMSNHTKAIEFYKELVESNPDVWSPYLYLLDNLIADHRADEAEAYLDRLEKMDARPDLRDIYRAHIALARFDEQKADAIMEGILEARPDDPVALFEAAQYYAEKCDYDRAVALYEKSFEKETRRPRFTDDLMAIRDIHEIRGEYREAAADCDRILDLLKNEWGITEGDELGNEEKRKAELLAKA